MTTSFGTLRIVGSHWEIACEPQVRTRLKRVFPRIDQVAGDTVMLSCTPEHCRDLAWFVTRYPLHIEHNDRVLLERGVAEHIDTETRLADLLEARRPPAAVELAEPARDYQLLAADACEIRKGLLLADEVGVGKTVAGIVPMANGKNLPALFVCETHLTRQMERAINRFLPDLATHRIRKGTPYELMRDRPALGLSRKKLPDVFIISYHMLRGWADQLGELIRYCVFDECQRLRRPRSQIYLACKHVAGKARMNMGLSATPIYNYGGEFFWVIDCLLPGVLGSRTEFVREWCGDGERIGATEEFGSYLRREGIMLRRTRRDVGRELARVQRIVHTVDYDPKALQAMEGDAVKLARIILSHNERFKGEHMRAAGELDIMLRQATGIAKAPFVAEFVRLLIESGETVLVFGWHREVYRIWNEKLWEYRPIMFTGSESPAQKAAAERAFVSGSSRVMFMSLRSGAGVDGLQQACRTVVFGEIDWSPGVHDQCIGRVDRDGQQDPVVAYFLLSDDGADPIMAEVNGIKLEQREGVTDPGRPIVERIDTGEHHLRRLARELLARRGEPVPERAAK